MTPFPHAARRAIAGTAFTLAAGVLAACSGSSGQAAPTKTVTVTSSPSAQPGSSTAAPATSAAPAPTPAGPGPCPTSSLHVSLGPAQGAAGSTYLPIDFTNIGSVTCTLYGYPGVSLAGGTPVAQIGPAASESSSSPRQLVTLAPGAVANALLQVVNALNFPATKCGPTQSTYLRVYPPNQTASILVSYATTACSKQVGILTVGVVKPGSGS